MAKEMKIVRLLFPDRERQRRLKLIAEQEKQALQDFRKLCQKLKITTFTRTQGGVSFTLEVSQYIPPGSRELILADGEQVKNYLLERNTPQPDREKMIGVFWQLALCAESRRQLEESEAENR